MSVFHEIDFPFPVALGARGGPQRRTEIVTLRSGREERNSPWAGSRRRWDAGPGVRTLDDVHTLIAFFEARRGPLHGFRFRDPLDHASGLPSQPPSPTDQEIGIGDGETTVFQLVKTYRSGAQSWSREIRKPVAGSVMAAVDGATAPAGTDPATGAVTLATPPGAGAIVTAGYLFDCPVRFETEALDISIDHVGTGQMAPVGLIEILA